MSWDHVLKSWILLLKSDSYKTEEYNFEYKSGLKDLTFQTGMSKTDMFSCLLFFYHTKWCGKPYFVEILSNKNYDIDVQSVIITTTLACFASAGGQGVLCGAL
jgi:hypothetical protein